MIYLCDISKSVTEEHTGRKLVLQNSSVAVPTERRIVLHGGDSRCLTEILSMLAGVRKPDRGRIIANRIRCSPVINAGGTAGSTLVPQLTVLENIRVVARAYGLDEARLLGVVESACHLDRLLAVPVRTFNWPTRRKLEATLIAALPFDCYFVDRLHELEGQFVWQLIHVAGKRGAGIIFTSTRVKQTLKIAEMAIVVRNGSAELLPHVRKAITQHVH